MTDVEILGRWMHATMAEIEPTAGEYSELSEHRKKRYQHVARALLERPPDVLLLRPLIVSITR